MIIKPFGKKSVREASMCGLATRASPCEDICDVSFLRKTGSTRSHDRYFLNRVCASILAFEGDGVVRYSIGDYDYYLEKRAERLASSAAPPTTASSATGSERLITAQRPRKLKWSERQELETIEDKILAAEEDVVRLEAQFADSDFYTKHGQHWQMFDAQLQTARENVSQLYSRWQELERIRAER